MRWIALVIVLALGAGGRALAADVQRTLNLSGLTCVACSAAVTKALEQIPGVRNASVNEERTQAVVVVDESVPSAALIEAVERAGYKAAVAGGATGAP